MKSSNLKRIRRAALVRMNWSNLKRFRIAALVLINWSNQMNSKIVMQSKSAKKFILHNHQFGQSVHSQFRPFFQNAPINWGTSRLKKRSTSKIFQIKLDGHYKKKKNDMLFLKLNQIESIFLLSKRRQKRTIHKTKRRQTKLERYFRDLSEN